MPRPDHVSQGLYPDYDEISHLASSLMNHTREREGDFCHIFGPLLGTVELSRRKLADMKVAVKAKRDDLIMMDNLIKLKEREVEDLQTVVNSARSGKRKQSPASVTEINSPCKPTSLSQTASQPDMASAQTAPRTLDEYSTLSATTLAEIKVNKNSKKLFPTAPTPVHLKPVVSLMNKQHLPRSNILNNLPTREKSTSPVSKPVNKEVPAATKRSPAISQVEVQVEGQPREKSLKPNRRGSIVELCLNKRSVVTEEEFIKVENVARRESGPSGNGDCQFQAVQELRSAPETCDENVQNQPKPIKMRVGLTKNFKGKLHDLMVVYSNSVPSLESIKKEVATKNI